MNETNKMLASITIRTELKPGDLGYVIYRHGKLYDEEYHYGISFETYVALGMHEFYEKYNDESYTMLSSDWVNNEISSPSGFALTRMKEIIRNVKLS